ncbi:MAG TPA: hypothetical protein VG406_17810 [Isosphaeraceae bacterium]|jgi:hypothetical protein|nr:hypothetical protein [Isosphaeraceae bacterium]
MQQDSPTVLEFCCPEPRLSVHDQSALEALQYKWIESERAGHDLGDAPILDWIRQHWNGFLRARWIEHLQGRAFWIELDHDDFGLLQRWYRDSWLLDEILARLKCGDENLGILNWAIDVDLPMEDVIDILETLDINARRIECRLCARPAHMQAS